MTYHGHLPATADIAANVILREIAKLVPSMDEF